MAKEVFDAPSGVLDGDRWRPIASILRIRRILYGNMDQLNEQMAHSLIYNLIITLALNNSHLQSTPIEHQFEIKSTSIHHLHQVNFKQWIRRILVSTEIIEAEDLANDIITWSADPRGRWLRDVELAPAITSWNRSEGSHGVETLVADGFEMLSSLQRSSHGIDQKDLEGKRAL